MGWRAVRPWHPAPSFSSACLPPWVRDRLPWGQRFGLTAKPVCSFDSCPNTFASGKLIPDSACCRQAPCSVPCCFLGREKQGAWETGDKSVFSSRGSALPCSRGPPTLLGATEGCSGEPEWVPAPLGATQGCSGEPERVRVPGHQCAAAGCDTGRTCQEKTAWIVLSV